VSLGLLYLNFLNPVINNQFYNSALSRSSPSVRSHKEVGCHVKYHGFQKDTSWSKSFVQKYGENSATITQVENLIGNEEN